MNPALRVGWEVVVGAANAASALAVRSNGETAGKLRQSLALRHGVRTRIAGRARQRDRQRPLCWLHAPSVGEGLQARPILQALREQAPHCQLAYTYFSPSATPFANALVRDGLADWADVLPFDSGADAELLLDSWHPTALVFVKLDVWPILTSRAATRGIPTALMSATLAANSSRQGWMAQALLRDAYRSLSAVGAISTADAERLGRLGVRPEVLSVTGDTRMDQVASRAAGVTAAHPVHRLLAPTVGAPTVASQPDGAAPDATPSDTGAAVPTDHPARDVLVAGSTWPADEAVLLPAFAQWRTRCPAARLIIAPHEPTASHLAPITAWAQAQGVALARLGEAEAAPDRPWDILLVDRVGVLGDLYALGSCAFVGGGFHGAGLHSVLEPAAFGIPVLFGPHHRNAREAGLLRDAGGAQVVADSAALADQLERWSAHPGERLQAGAAARQLIDTSRGSTARVLALLEGLLPGLLATP